MSALEGRTIALAEGRQLEELAALIEKEGATALRCPLLAILDAPDDAPLLAWLDRLQAGAFDWIIFLTGEGVRRLLACAERHGKKDAVIAALATTKHLTRGPKPGRALKEIGLAPTLIAQAPTTDGVIATLGAIDLEGRTIGVQLYSDSNPPLVQFLESAGAKVVTVQPYIYAAAGDVERVVALMRALAEGKVDALVFTSSPQVDRLFEIAQERNEIARLTEGLGKTLVAAVGPIVAESLQKRGIQVNVCPEQGFVMKNLVQHLKKAM